MCVCGGGGGGGACHPLPSILLTCKFSDFANPFLIFIFLSVAMVSRMLPSNAFAMTSKGHVEGRISTVCEQMQQDHQKLYTRMY